jgi:broad specificity phosphatase PhoE
MHIVLFRHAEKDHATTANPPLSRRGLQQAEKLIELVGRETLPSPDLLFSSPKIRALQTFSALAAQKNLEIRQISELEERQSSETSGQFFNRVKTYLAWLKTSQQNIYLVTHLDWVEEALAIIPCDVDLTQEQYHVWLPAQYMHFEVIDDLWLLRRFGSVQP